MEILSVTEPYKFFAFGSCANPNRYANWVLHIFIPYLHICVCVSKACWSAEEVIVQENSPYPLCQSWKARTTLFPRDEEVFLEAALGISGPLRKQRGQAWLSWNLSEASFPLQLQPFSSFHEWPPTRLFILQSNRIKFAKSSEKPLPGTCSAAHVSIFLYKRYYIHAHSQEEVPKNEVRPVQEKGKRH